MIGIENNYGTSTCEIRSLVAVVNSFLFIADIAVTIKDDSFGIGTSVLNLTTLWDALDFYPPNSYVGVSHMFNSGYAAVQLSSGCSSSGNFLSVGRLSDYPGIKIGTKFNIFVIAICENW